MEVLFIPQTRPSLCLEGEKIYALGKQTATKLLSFHFVAHDKCVTHQNLIYMANLTCWGLKFCIQSQCNCETCRCAAHMRMKILTGRVTPCIKTMLNEILDKKVSKMTIQCQLPLQTLSCSIYLQEIGFRKVFKIVLIRVVTLPVTYNFV